MKDITRRGMIGGLVTGAAASVPLLNAEGAQRAAPAPRPLRAFRNEEFYTNGNFNVQAAKGAYYELMAHYSYPIPPRLRGDDFWTLDFHLGRFTEVGMGGIFWINDRRGFFGHEIYLLPGQMIPEHQHMPTDAGPAKLEGWHTRYGWVYVYGEGEPTPGVAARIPPSHRQCAVARHELRLNPGECTVLNRATAKHWMRAGPQGAIVSEYATFHDNAGLRFTHPDVRFP